MKILWDKLESYRPFTNCTCHYYQCMRNAREFMVKEVIQFLTCLSDKFLVVQTPILLMEPLPSLNCVYSLILQD